MAPCIFKPRSVATIVLLILSYHSKSTDAFAGIFGDGKGAGGGGGGGGGGASEGIDLANVAPDPVEVAGTFFDGVFSYLEGGGSASASGSNMTNATAYGGEQTFFGAVIGITIDTALQAAGMTFDNLIGELLGGGDASEETEVDTAAAAGGKQGARRDRRVKRGLRGVRN